MSVPFILRDYYFQVLGDSRVYATARRIFVAADDAQYVSFVARGGVAWKVATEADLWQLLASGAPDLLPEGIPAAVAARKDHQISKADKVAFEVAFNHENRLRTLEGLQPITKQQFLNGIRNLL